MTEVDIIAVDPNVYQADDNQYPDDWQSETTSIGSSIYRGLMENGRRYQSLRSDDYLLPVDDPSFETYEAAHLLAIIMDSERDNPLFRAPIGENPTHILDLGTGKGNWAIDVADMFPTATVRGVDLFPPPITWMPPNCVLEVDDAIQPWTWKEPFDLIHLRIMTASWTDGEWDNIYKQCYDNLKPGAWIEQLEALAPIGCDDGSLPKDSILNSWGTTIMGSAERSGRGLDAMLTMTEGIRKAGFVDIHEKKYKWPIGPWPKDKQLKEAGMVNFQHWLSGLEGWCMYLLTKFGAPRPWTKEEVLVYVSSLRKELQNPHYHSYVRSKRVWARKPFPEEVAALKKKAAVEIKREE
ncbi:hypothetical protein N7493_003968 [Penicillium malachiteum]|uniref:Uncharacterized protein n=1 Tax=Penicillium malachiteum TaxID=1324776 RepID=A0AAD6MXZ2_9EURO|nr:hypothetical protein N7493_003968 [Penicillium malachiteum]